jgi:hypothetical protein
MTWGSTRRWGNCSTRNPTATFGAVRVARAHVVVVVVVAAAITRHDAKSAKVRCERAFEVQQNVHVRTRFGNARMVCETWP